MSENTARAFATFLCILLTCAGSIALVISHTEQASIKAARVEEVILDLDQRVQTLESCACRE